MRKLRSLIILLTFLIVVCLSSNVIAQENPELVKVKVHNTSECLLAFISIVKIEFIPGTKKLKEMKLHWASWMEPGELSYVYLRVGDYYAMYSEGWEWNPETKQPTVRRGAGYREGVYKPDKSGRELIIRGGCKGSLPKFNI